MSGADLGTIADLKVPSSYPPDMTRAAARTVVAHSLDFDDATTLLAMIGLDQVYA